MTFKELSKLIPLLEQQRHTTEAKEAKHALNFLIYLVIWNHVLYFSAHWSGMAIASIFCIVNIPSHTARLNTLSRNATD